MKLIALALLFGFAALTSVLWAVLALNSPLGIDLWPILLMAGYSLVAALALGLFFARYIDSMFLRKVSRENP